MPLGLRICASIPKFSSRQNRFKNKKELYDILEKIFLEKTGEEWLDLLEKQRPHRPYQHASTKRFQILRP